MYDELVELIRPGFLADAGMGHDDQTRDQLRDLIVKGALSAGSLATDDCRGDFERLSANGVEFLQQPTERPYGIEAVFRDDSGNWFSLNQTFG